MNRIIPCMIGFVGILLPLVNAGVFYFYNLHEFTIINVFVAGVIVAIVGCQWYFSRISKVIEKEYRDGQIRQLQAQDEFAVLWQKEIDDMGLEAEVIIDETGQVTLRESDKYIDNDDIKVSYTKAMRKLNLRSLKNR